MMKLIPLREGNEGKLFATASAIEGDLSASEIHNASAKFKGIDNSAVWAAHLGQIFTRGFHKN